jgi:two-component system sensor histidine kinase KdpD
MIGEFDLDAALARHPALILVDELAHTNAPGSRHKKRWQDVMELLGSGIDVFTTMNVQHLESLNDVVSQITGIPVRETVPDQILKRADLIRLVDLSADELILRMKEGKVYLPEQTQRALRHFFRKGNLTALRELTLRQVAEQVDSEMERYRITQGIKEIWPAGERILVAIGPNPMGVRLIRSARRMAGALHAEWIVLHIDSPASQPLSEAKSRILSDHMKLAERLGAETAVLSGVSIAKTLLDFAKDRNVTKIIVGKPTHPPWRDKVFGSLLEEIVRGSGNIDVYVITGDPDPAPTQASPKIRKKGRARDWLFSLGTVGAITGLSLPFRGSLSIVDVVMLYLLGIVLIARWSEEAPALVATGSSVAALDFFFVPPYNSFAVTDVRYFGTFAVMFVVGTVINRLTFRLRHQEEATRQREERTLALYSLSRELSRQKNREEVGRSAARQIASLFFGEITFLLFDPEDKGKPPRAIGTEEVPLSEREQAVAQWVFLHQEMAGFGTDTLPDSEALYLPLVGPTRKLGVLRLHRDKARGPLDTQSLPLLEHFASLTAVAMERSTLEEEHLLVRIESERERMRNTLLSSVSHDLRTPLGVITGAASTLVSQREVLSPEHRRELEHTIESESRRLTRLIGNVLEITRLGSGPITLNRNYLSMEELIGSALSRLGPEAVSHPVSVDIPELPLVFADELLLSQALSNLLENAVRHTPLETPIAIRAEVKEKDHQPWIHVAVEDSGPGIPAGSEKTIFEKTGETRDSHAKGLGIGLSLVKTILSLHGGSVWAENRSPRGAAFHFSLPAGAPPPLPPKGTGPSLTEEA